MRTVMKELWKFSLTIWKQRNAEPGSNYMAPMAQCISMEEQRRKDTAEDAVAGDGVPGYYW
jgi:hypothetical protein